MLMIYCNESKSVTIWAAGVLRCPDLPARALWHGPSGGGMGCWWLARVTGRASGPSVSSRGSIWKPEVLQPPSWIWAHNHNSPIGSQTAAAVAGNQDKQ